MANRIPGADFNCKSLFCCYSGRKLGPYSNSKQSIIVHCFGEVSEWLIEQPWKGCVGLVPTAGSNPALSVMSERDAASFFTCCTCRVFSIFDCFVAVCPPSLGSSEYVWHSLILLYHWCRIVNRDKRSWIMNLRRWS